MESPKPAPTAAPTTGAANDVAQELTAAQWAQIMQQLGAEIAGPLSAALERIHNLTVTGQIDRQSLRTLRESVGHAREAGMLGQQLARLASGRLRLARERLHLAQLLRGVLAQRSRETQARGIQIRQMLKPIEVMADGALMHSLLNALMDWALNSTHSSIDLRLDLTPWPHKAMLVCRFAHRSQDLTQAALNTAEPPATLNSLAWRLVEQTALTMGVLPLREDQAGITVLTLEFPQTMGEDDAPAPPAPPVIEPAAAAKPLTGSHLLIVSPRQELRSQLQSAVQHMGLLTDAVDSVAQAADFCAEGLPHVILFESALRSPELERLRHDLSLDAPGLCFIEVLDGEQLTQLSTATPEGIARISRSHVDDALPSVLRFELSKPQ